MIGSLGVSRQLVNGSVSLNFNSQLDDTGNRSSLTASRTLDLPRGTLSLTFGATQSGSGDVNPTFSVAYLQTLSRGQLTATLDRRVISTTDDTSLDQFDEVLTRANVTYTQALTTRSGVSLGLNYAEVQSPGSSRVVGRSNYGLTASLDHQLTSDWTLSTGYQYRHQDDDVAGAASSNEVFVTIGRRFVTRP